MGDNRSAKEKYTNLSEVFGPTIRDYEGRMGETYDRFSNQYNQNAQQMGQFANMAQGAMDPEAFLRQSQNWFDPLSQTVSGPNSQLQQALNAQAALAAEDAGQAAASQFGQKGALNSSAATEAMGRAMAKPFAQAQLQTQQNQLGLTGNLWNQAMGGLNQGNLAQAQGLQNLAQLYGNQVSNLGGQLGNLASQGFTVQQPQLEYQQTPWESFWGNANTMIQPVAGAAGTAVGAATGMNSLG